MTVGEPAMRQVMKWLDEQRRERPGASPVELVDEASRRFDLTPLQADFLLRHVSQQGPPIENIQKTVADYYKIKVSEMYSKKRTRNVARPRQVAMALAKELTQMSLPDIGEAFGGRDHTTVLHACRKIAELRGTSTEITADMASLLKVLRS